MNLIKAALKNHHIVTVFSIIILLVGMHALMTMPRRATPKITVFQGLVIAFYPGATAEQVEQQVTKELERYLFTFSEIDQGKTSSITRDGQVVITVNLREWVEDMEEFWSKLKLDLFQLKETNLPKDIIGPIVDSDFGDTVALLIAVESDRRTYAELKKYLERIEDSVRTLEITGKINNYGYQNEQIYVTADSRSLAQYGLTIQKVVDVLKSQNSIDFTGSIKTDYSHVPLHTTGLYTSVEQIKKQQIYISPTGDILRIGDVANVERRLEEAKSLIRVNGRDSTVLLMSVEMQPGKNIVDFGKNVQKKLREVAGTFPPDINFITINNQPEVVSDGVNDFIREFFIAVGAVILVTILLLPFRIASIAAMAIPITISFTFAMLDFVGIELHEVSLAAMIVVLGMVVDDAIVITDNYIEKLNEGLDCWNAAWRSASELFIPVLTATLAIIAAFLPLAFFLTGPTGEFIFALPITVMIALSASFTVAMLVTPFLCYTFIKEGLGASTADQGNTKRKKFSLLDLLQKRYDSVIAKAMKHPVMTITGGIMVIIAGVMLLFFVKQKFFPAAERAQFVIEINMPQGTRLEVTDRAVRKIEELIKKDKRILGFASFTGTSAPRVYYSFAPEFPRENYAMLLVNTGSVDKADEVVAEYSRKMKRFIPNADINVMQFQQGIPVNAPVEVRIVGYDLKTLKELGRKISAIFKEAKGSNLVRTDYRDNYFLDISVNEEVANKLGFTTGIIARMVAIGFEGAAVSTLWEEDNNIDIVFRLDRKNREDFDDLADMYIGSPITKSSIPLRQISELIPKWETGQIARRNGMRTLTVGCRADVGVLPSTVLSQIMPKVNKIALPPGCRIEYGGEYEGQVTTFKKMAKALVASLLLIYIILLFQFKNSREPIIIMLAIPLTLLGAILGLLITGNPFGFTAFVGVISLVGIVIRNSIILVDYGDELVKTGMSYKEAALDAGRRRLRPIFLTSMAAAAGVVPMILSGSPLWAPLASVFSVGVIFSMVMTLIIIPVVYAIIMKARAKKKSSVDADTCKLL